MFVLLLCGLFCCLGFSSVVLFAVWAGACFLFCSLGGGACPAQTAKKKHAPAQTAKKNTTRPLPSVFLFCCLGGWACYFFAVWALGGCRVFFSCLGGGVFMFLLIGRGACCFCCLGGGRFFFCCSGGGREFTHVPVCLTRL